MKRKIIFNSFGFPINVSTGEIIDGNYSDSEIVESGEILSDEPKSDDPNPNPEKPKPEEPMPEEPMPEKPKVFTTTNKEINNKNEYKNSVEKQPIKLNYPNRCKKYEKYIESTEPGLIQKKKQDTLVKAVTEINGPKANNEVIFQKEDKNKRNKSTKKEKFLIKNNEKDIASDKMMIKSKEEKINKSKHIKAKSPSKEISEQVEASSHQNNEVKIININEIKEKLSLALIHSNPENAKYLTSIYNRSNQMANEPSQFMSYHKMLQSLDQCPKDELITGLFLFMHLNKKIFQISRESKKPIKIPTDSWDASSSLPKTKKLLTQPSPPASSLIKPLTKNEIDNLLQENKLYSSFLFVLGKYYQTKKDLLLKEILRKKGIIFDKSQGNISQVLYNTDYFNIVMLYSPQNGFSHRVDYLNMKRES